MLCWLCAAFAMCCVCYVLRLLCAAFATCCACYVLRCCVLRCCVLRCCVLRLYIYTVCNSSLYAVLAACCACCVLCWLCAVAAVCRLCAALAVCCCCRVLCWHMLYCCCMLHLYIYRACCVLRLYIYCVQLVTICRAAICFFYIYTVCRKGRFCARIRQKVYTRVQKKSLAHQKTAKTLQLRAVYAVPQPDSDRNCAAV